MSEKLSPEEVNRIYPIVGVEVYPRSIVIIRDCLREVYPTHVRQRGVIKMLSKRSLSRFLFLVGTRGDVYKSLLTLTYGPNYPIQGKTAKRHLRAILEAIRRRFDGVQYFWFVEFQARGAPHFHVGLSVEPNWEDRAWLSIRWSELVEPDGWLYNPGLDPLWWSQHPKGYLTTRQAVLRQHRRDKVWELIRSPDGAVRYVARYFGKSGQKKVPEYYTDIGRFWGINRLDNQEIPKRFTASEEDIRNLVNALGRDVSGFDVLPKIIFHSGKIFDNCLNGE